MSPNYPKMEDCMQVVAPVNVNSTISANIRSFSTTGISTNTSNLVLVFGFQPRVVASAIAIVSLGMIFPLSPLLLTAAPFPFPYPPPVLSSSALPPPLV
ncbi:hypothetical protein L6452_31164 [Arctium lappa]|uniref:Uncharacterized protein n=1 Tax=Arctium lappa TaxID=4217 RepID=A0ACB8ZJA3_ARCLA|nr:hypothetical protein L6452_31164 [Arctium lappa]